MNSTKYLDENRTALKTLLFSVLSKYKTVVVVDDMHCHYEYRMKHIVDFFNSFGIDDINYIYVDDGVYREDICSLTHKDNRSACSCKIQNYITVKVSDLSIYPCYKCTKHSILKYGYIDENLMLYPENVELAIITYFYNPTYSNPKCDVCRYAPLCHKGCYVERYNFNKDFFHPVEEKCIIYQSEIDCMVANSETEDHLFQLVRGRLDG